MPCWAVKDQQKTTVEAHEKLVTSIQTQIDRINRMDDVLYEDRLAGDITADKYKEKHEQFIKQKAELTEQLNGTAVSTTGHRLDQRLVLLELSQKASEIYATKTSEQKRLIISNLFSKLTLKDGILSVSYTKFAEVIAQNVLETNTIMEASK